MRARGVGVSPSSAPEAPVRGRFLAADQETGAIQDSGSKRRYSNLELMLLVLSFVGVFAFWLMEAFP